MLRGRCPGCFQDKRPPPCQAQAGSWRPATAAPPPPNVSRGTTFSRLGRSAQHLRQVNIMSRKSLSFRVPALWMGSPHGEPGDSASKASAHNARDLGLFPWLGRSPGEGNGNPLQYSCLENPMVRGAWQSTVHGVAKSRTRLRNFTIYYKMQASLYIV